MTSTFVRRAWCAAALLLAAPAALLAQAATGTVRGRVTDAASGRGLADAQVQVAGTRAGALSLASGNTPSPRSRPGHASSRSAGSDFSR